MAYVRTIYPSHVREEQILRFVGESEKIFQYFHKNTPRINKLRVDQDPNLIGEYHEAVRILSWAFHRNDGNDLVIAMLPISAWTQMTGVESDYVLKRTGHGLQTRYSMIRRKTTVLTPEELSIFEGTSSQVSSLVDTIINRRRIEITKTEIEPIHSRFEIMELDWDD